MRISLEESTTENITPILETIVKNMSEENKPPDSIQKDYLFVLLVVLMSENGFVLVDDDHEILELNSINNIHINKWKSQTGVYTVSLIMMGFKNTPVTLLMSPLGAMAFVNVVINDFDAETYSVCLPMSKYVAAPQATTIPMKFRDLKHFSACLKNKVLSAVKSRILDYYGYISASLVGLPEEILFNIMYHLPVGDVINVSKTCMRLRELLLSDCLWRDLLKRDFVSARDIPYSGAFDWRVIYKHSYAEQKDKNTARQNAMGSMHDYMDYADHISYVDNPLWNVLLQF